ncbi:hypothetical protein JNW88_01790 [Micromonospora sp. ATA32]|nr:hypothetical protein [Micromonospora sp. ATA32]
MVRLEPVGSGRWLLSRDDRLRGHRVSAVTAAALVTAFAETNWEELTTTISAWTSSQNSALKIVDWLVAQEYLVDSSRDDVVGTPAWLGEWNANGWRAAARYHARTFGYPFELYEVDGSSAEDVRRMVAYNQQQPDVDRARGKIAGAKASYPLPGPAAELNEVRSGAVVDHETPERKLDREALVDLLSLLSRPVRTMACRTRRRRHCCGRPVRPAEAGIRPSCPSSPAACPA